MSKVRRLSSKTIDDFTKLGYNELQSGNLNTAIDAFKNAHRHSIYLNDSNTEQLCAFNLGAAYVAAKKPREGLELLSSAVPPAKELDEKPRGDIYFNFGMGYETMDNMDDSIKYFELALESYQEEKRDAQSSKKILTVARKLGFCYGKMGSCSQAVDRLKIVTNLHDELEEEDVRERIPVLCELCSQLASQDKCAEALHYTNECFNLCRRMEDCLKKGEIYHDLGLIYVHCKEYTKGCCCFELALPLIRTAEPGGAKEAAVIQNLGACYNALGDYQRSLGFHEQALENYAGHQDQSGQAQCFNNLAFALINLGLMDGAEDAHMHALNASLDIGDTHNQWQSLEGLGTVAFNKGHVDEAIGHFRESVSVLASNEENYPAHHRLLTKYSDAVKYKDMYAVRSIPPPPVINASLSVNFCESYQRAGKFFDEEKERDRGTIQELEQSKTSSTMFETVPEDSENDSVFSDVSSESLDSEEMYQTDTMLRRYKEQQLAKSLSLERTKQTSSLRRTRSENLSTIAQGKNAVEIVNKLLMSRARTERMRSSQMEEYVPKSERLRRSLQSRSGRALSDSETDDSVGFYCQNEEEQVEPEYADRLSKSTRQGLTTLDINEKKALLTRSNKFKPVPTMTEGKPKKSKRLLSKEREEMKSQIENDGILLAYKQVGFEKTGGKKRAKKKKGAKGGRKKKASMNKSGDSGVFEESISPEGASLQKNELHLDLSKCSNSDEDTDEVEDEVTATSAAVAQDAPNTEAIESGTIAGSSLTQLKDKKSGRKLPSRRNKKDVCGTSTDVVDATSPSVTINAQTGGAEEESNEEEGSRFLNKAVQTPRQKKSVLCTLL